MTEFDLYCWLKHEFWRFSQAEWTTYAWAKKWGNPFEAYQEGGISLGKLTEILAAELYAAGWRKEPTCPS